MYFRLFLLSFRYCLEGALGATIIPMTPECSPDISTFVIIISFVLYTLFGFILFYIGTRQPDLNFHHIFNNIKCYFCTNTKPTPQTPEPDEPLPISTDIVPQLLSLRDIPDDSYVFVDILLSLYIFYFQVKDSRKRDVWTLAIINFVTRFYKTKDLVEKVMDIILGDEVLLFQPHINPQSGECGPRKILNRWRDTTEGELLSKLKRVTFGLMTAGLVTAYDLPFTKIGLQSWKSSSKEIKFSSVHDMLYSVADLFVSFYETGYECFLSGSIQPLIVADRECATWITEVEAIHEEISRLPTNSNPDHQKILTTMTSLVEKGRMLDRKLNPRIISLYYRPLIAERLRFAQKYGIPSFRRPPFSLTIAGPPGIGKSAVTKLLVDHYHQVVKTENIYPDLEWDPSTNMYSVNYEDEYWSGFRGAQHWCVLLDDLANEPKSWAAKGLKFSASHLIQIVNVFGMATTQAAIEDKGVIPLLPKLVIATTNNEGLHASHVSVSPASILRRLPYVITPIVKPQFCRPDSKMMKQMDEPVLDPWMFELKKVKVDALNPDHARYELVFPEPITMAQLTRYLKGEILNHERSSDTLLKTMTTRTNTILCPHGTPTIYACDMCSSSLVPQKGFLPYLQTRSLYLGVSFFSKLPTAISMPIIESLVNHGRISRSFTFQVCSILLKRHIPTYVQRNRDIFLALSGIVGGGSLLYILFRMFPDLSTSAEDEPIQEPTKSDPDIITQNDLWTVPENFFRVPSTSKSGNLEELIASVSSSIFLLEYKSDIGEPGRVTTLCLTNNLFLTVNHPFLCGTSWKCIARFGISYNKLNNAIRFTLNRDQIYYLGNDICVFNTNAMIPRKNLMNFIPNEADYAGRSIISLGFDPMGKLERGKFLTTRSEDKAYSDPDSKQIISGTFMVGRREDRPCMKGDCGTVMLSKSHKGYFISGIHCAGSTVDTSIALITQLDKKSILTINVPQSGYLLPYETDKYFSCDLQGRRILKGPGQKQIADWMDCGYCNFLGTFDRRISATSKTQFSMIKDEVMQTLHVDCPYLPPLMKPIYEDKVWKNPFTISANKQSKIPPYFQESILDVAVKDFIFKLTYSTDWLSNVKTESQCVAINGIPGNDMIHSLKRDTSGGHLFPGMKLKYMSEIDENIYMVSPAVQERIDYIEDQYCKGHRVGILFDGTLKDEAITLAKRAEGKTRVFTACDMAFSIVVRKQYIRITEAIMRSNFISECAAGMDHYRAWPALYKYLTRFGDNCIVAGDYSSFDKCMPPILIERAFYIMDYLRNLVCPLSTKDILISRGIATDVAFPITNLNGDLFQFFGGNSSGHPLTVIINSLVNSLYVRYVYYNSDRAFGSFLDNVRLMTLGDDNIFGSNDPTFNHTSLADGLAKLEIKYTMADKESESVPFLNIEEVDFLKRKFRHLHGMCVAPIAMDSITRSLLIFTNHDIISEEERLANTYLSARREWALHGQNTFEIMTSRMDIIFNKYPQIQRFFINKHKLSFIDTLRWCYEDDDKQKIVL